MAEKKHAGKGDNPRPVNLKKYQENYDKIFKKKPNVNTVQKSR